MKHTLKRPLIFDSVEGYLRFLSWLCLTVIAVFNAAIAHHLDLYYKYTSDLLFGVLICLPFIIITMILRSWERVRTANTIEIILLFQMYGAVFVYFNHACIALSSIFPYYDRYFLAFDKMIGVDWPATLHWVDNHPEVIDPLTYLYDTFLYQFTWLLIVLVLLKRHVKVYSLILASIFVCFGCLVISGLLPCENFITYMHMDKLPYAHYFFNAGDAHIPTLHLLRSGGMRIIYIYKGEGLIGFPSYHASFAILCMWCLWDFKWLRWPGVVIYSLMLWSILVVGGHYMADIVGGVLVAFVSIYLVKRIASARAARLSENAHYFSSVPRASA